MTSIMDTVNASQPLLLHAARQPSLRALLVTIFCFLGSHCVLAAEEAHSTSEVLSASALKSVSQWFTTADKGALDMPLSVSESKALTKDQVKDVQQTLWQAYQNSPVGRELATLLPDPYVIKTEENPTPQACRLATGDKVMPFYFMGKGDLQGKRPLFIALHGGGSAGGRAPSPHGWSVNTREWAAQTRLSARVYPTDALYFVPRMADDNDGRWYYHYCQDAYDKVVRAAILHHQVDPNRVYLIGISEGAYTAYRMGAFMADRWAGAGSMAGGEPLRNAPPENMRNLAFRADIGEKDTMFDRIGLNQRYGQALENLKQNDPDGYVYKINVQAGRGHGIDYKPCPAWLTQYQRNPWPSRVTWKVIKVHGRRKGLFYWLAMDQDPNAWPCLIDARIDRETNTVRITVEKEEQDGKRSPTHDVALRLYLNDDLLDLDKPVRVVRNGKDLFNGTVSRRIDVMMKSLAERGDPSYVFPVQISLPSASDGKD
ncbi:MAG: hypothetical protein HQ515_11925 [Phycisphaeraceae bacterium]|nr:hypothetical protein [Phycisphaeraceae bacterium]